MMHFLTFHYSSFVFHKLYLDVAKFKWIFHYLVCFSRNHNAGQIVRKLKKPSKCANLLSS